MLGDPPARGTGLPAETIRKAVDLALGYDVGAAVLEELVEALSATPIAALVGNGGTTQLTAIDPATASVAEPVEPDDYDDEEEEEEDYYEDDTLAEQYEEPPVVIMTVEATAVAEEKPVEQVSEEDVEAPVITDEPAIEDFHDAAVLTIVETEDALDPAPERVELWLDFRDHYEDRRGRGRRRGGRGAVARPRARRERVSPRRQPPGRRADVRDPHPRAGRLCVMWRDVLHRVWERGILLGMFRTGGRTRHTAPTTVRASIVGCGC